MKCFVAFGLEFPLHLLLTQKTGDYFVERITMKYKWYFILPLSNTDSLKTLVVKNIIMV